MVILSEGNTKLMAGYQAAIQGALAAGCRHYFAAPSLYQSLLLSEGARSFPEVHGIFTQAETPASALAMAMGAAALGARVLVSCNDQGFAALQEVLSYCLAEELPCVIALYSDGGPGLGHTQPTGNHLRYFLQPELTGGFALPALLPYNPQNVYALTMQAFELSDRWRIPVLLVLEPIVFHAVTEVRLLAPQPDQAQTKPWAIGEETRQFICQEGPERLAHFERKQTEMNQVMEPLHELRWNGHDTRLLLGTGSMADFLLQLPEKKWSVFVPLALWPFPQRSLANLLQQKPDLRLTWLEYDQPFLGQRVQQLYPDLSLNVRGIPYSRLSLQAVQTALTE